MTGIERIARERQRQIEVEGWTATHDDGHVYGEMALAAACYATPILLYRFENSYVNRLEFVDPWPEEWRDWDKRPYPCGGNVVGRNCDLPVTKRIRQLEKAGALIAAEIDRLQREAK
jgi:hypothetical protein